MNKHYLPSHHEWKVELKELKEAYMKNDMEAHKLAWLITMTEQHIVALKSKEDYYKKKKR